MYAIRCPHCTKLLQLNRPVENTKMKCRNCGAVFIGTTTEISGDAPPPPTDPAAILAASAAAPPTPRRRPAQGGPRAAGAKSKTARQGGQAGAEDEYEEEIPAWRRRKPAWQRYLPVTITGILIVLVVVIVIFFFHIHNHPTVKFEVAKADVDRIRQQLPTLSVVETYGNTVLLQGKVTRDQMPLIEKIRKDGLPAPDRPDLALPPIASAPPPPPPGSGSGDAMAEPLPPGDPNVDVMMTDQPQTIDDAPNSGYLVGRVHNKGDFPIEQVQVDVYTHSSEGVRRAPIPVKLAYIPPGGSLRICTTYTGLSAGEVTAIRAVAQKPTRPAPGTLCWALEDLDRTFADGTLTVTGEVVNPGDTPLKKVQIFVEVFDPKGIQTPGPQVIKAASLDGGATSLPARGKAKFTFTMNLAELGLSVLANQLEVAARVWASP